MHMNDTPVNLFQEILETITAASGIKTVLYDHAGFSKRSGRRNIDWTFDGHRCAFCTLARSTAAGRSACITSDVAEAVRDAAANSAPMEHVCHAGLIEVVVPVLYDGKHVATVFVGQSQVSGAPAARAAWLAERAAKLGLNAKKLISAYRALTTADRDMLMRIGKLVSLALRSLAETEDRAAFNRTLALTRNPAVRDIAAYADQHCCEDISIGMLARRVHHSSAYVSRMFHRTMGMTFSDYLASRRIDAAKKLLTTTVLSVADIAERTGYMRQSYFARKFRTLTGLAPLDYRRKYRRTK
ncbi:MAG: PocR ligand-binding domain-containing protein [Spirochaetota bacterium]